MAHKRSFNKRGQVDPEIAAAEAVTKNDFYHRTALNITLGMTARNPYAFQLSAEELKQAWEGAKNDSPPVPIATADNGLRMLIDPKREETRRRERDTLPEIGIEERKARYASYPGVLS